MVITTNNKVVWSLISWRILAIHLFGNRVTLCTFKLQYSTCKVSISKSSLTLVIVLLKERPSILLFCVSIHGVQAGFRKGRGTRGQIANICWIIEKAREFQKNIYCCQSLWLCRSQQTGKFFEKWEYQTTWPASWEICMQVRKQQLELDMEQQTGSK